MFFAWARAKFSVHSSESRNRFIDFFHLKSCLGHNPSSKDSGLRKVCWRSTSLIELHGLIQLATQRLKSGWPAATTNSILWGCTFLQTSPTRFPWWLWRHRRWLGWWGVMEMNWEAPWTIPTGSKMAVPRSVISYRSCGVVTTRCIKCSWKDWSGLRLTRRIFALDQH